MHGPLRIVSHSLLHQRCPLLVTACSKTPPQYTQRFSGVVEVLHRQRRVPAGIAETAVSWGPGSSARLLGKAGSSFVLLHRKGSQRCVSGGTRNGLRGKTSCSDVLDSCGRKESLRRGAPSQPALRARQRAWKRQARAIHKTWKRVN